MNQKWFSLFPLIALIIMLAVPQTVSAINEDDVRAVLNTMNDQLAAANKNDRVEYVEFSTFDEIGITVYRNNRELQLGSHWVPFDPNRGGTRNITWLIDQVDIITDPPMADANAAIGRAMNTWNTEPCANIPLIQLPDYGIDWGVVQCLEGWGGICAWYADITHAGWLPWGFFEQIGGPGGGNGIIGATFTFIWVDANGNPTDMDGNGKNDVAFREIYYNLHFDWGIDDPTKIDVETVVLHEVGHGLSMGHFGMIFRDAGTGHLQFAPRALMNAVYFGILQEPIVTDTASFCSIWAYWPNN
jgi:hypothetical protein